MSTRIMYLRAPNGHPVGCVAISVNKVPDKNTVTYSVSALHPNDRFNRSLAREIALGRLGSSTNPPQTLAISQINFTGWKDSLDGKMTVHDVSMGVMANIVDLGVNRFPARVVKAAKLWLKKNSEHKHVNYVS